MDVVRPSIPITSICVVDPKVETKPQWSTRECLSDVDMVRVVKARVIFAANMLLNC